MLCKCYWIVLYIVHFTAFCLGGPFFSSHGVDSFQYFFYHNIHTNLEVLFGPYNIDVQFHLAMLNSLTVLSVVKLWSLIQVVSCLLNQSVLIVIMFVFIFLLFRYFWHIDVAVRVYLLTYISYGSCYSC